MTTEIGITLGLLVFAMVMFFTEKLPVWVTAMIVLLVFIVTGILEPQVAFSGFTNTSVLLYLAMFIIGDALFVTGAASDIGGLVTRFAKTEKQTIIFIMILAGVMSGFLSNTGTAAIFIPIIIGIAKSSGYSRPRLLMPLVAAAAMGGNLTLLGSPPNIIASSALESGGYEPFSVFDFTPVALPIFVSGIIYYILIGYRLLPDETSERVSDGSSVYDADLDYSQVAPWRKYMSIGIMVLTVIAMVFEEQIGISFYVSAWIGAIILVVTGTISSKDALNSFDMSIVLLFVGTLSIGEALEVTGAGSMIARTVLNIVGDSPYAILAGILIVCIVITNFMSNTATAALMAPIGLNIAAEIGADPRAVLMAVVVGCSCAYATPIGMPTNTMVYGVGGFKFSDYTKVGLPLIFINFAVSMVILPIIYPFFP